MVTQHTAGRTVRIGAAPGFYGDMLGPAIENARVGDISYLCFDCLAELTLAILQKDRQKDSSMGYTRDVTPSMKSLLPIAAEKGIKTLTNAGGINPEGAQKEIVRIAKDLGLEGLKVARVTGDDVLNRLDELRGKGITLDHLETGRGIEEVRDRILFANAYLGTGPIVEALRGGADVVVTGRTTDSAQFLAPLVYEFGWEDEDRLAQGILMGHLAECSGQATGGNFSGDWQSVEDLDRIGFPLTEVREDSGFVITKPEGIGGLVSVDTVKEQMLYEIHDPASYVTPDVVLDMSEARLEDAGPNRVNVSGARGKQPPDTLKVVMGYRDDWMGQAMAGYSWSDALDKARAADRIVRKQIERMGLEYDELRTDFLGHDSLHGPLSEPSAAEPNEVYLRMALRTRDRGEAAKLGRLFPPMAINGPPTMSGFQGVARPRELLGMWSCLVSRHEIESHVELRIEEVA